MNYRLFTKKFLAFISWVR